MKKLIIAILGMAAIAYTATAQNKYPEDATKPEMAIIYEYEHDLKEAGLYEELVRYSGINQFVGFESFGEVTINGTSYIKFSVITVHYSLNKALAMETYYDLEVADFIDAYTFKKIYLKDGEITRTVTINASQFAYELAQE